MATRPDKREKQYYPTIQQFLSGQGYVTHSFDNKGRRFDFVSRGQGQLLVDVYGLKGSPDTRVQNIEGVAVEVKRRQTSTSLRYIAQAEGYSVLAHRCYLAQPLDDFSPKTKAEAARVGVGLLRIHGRSVEIVAESKLFQPDPVVHP